MSVHPLPLDGWDEQSIWGATTDHLYAQVTRNGRTDGPGFRIAPPRYPAITDVHELSRAIATVTGTEPAAVLLAMGAGLTAPATPPADRPQPGPPAVPPTDRPRPGSPHAPTDWPRPGSPLVPPAERPRPGSPAALSADQARPGPEAVPPTDQPRPGPAAGPAGGWVDLSRNAAGIGTVHEAARRRARDGTDADRSRRGGADGEAAVGAVLDRLCAYGRWARWRGRPRWRVLHSVPLGDGRGRSSGAIDHVLVGPPGVVTITTEHHTGGPVVCDGDTITVDGRDTASVAQARREAALATRLLTAALYGGGYNDLADRDLTVSGAVVVVGASVQVVRWPRGVLVVPAAQLAHRLRSMTPRWGNAEIETVYTYAVRSTTWDRDVR